MYLIVKNILLILLLSFLTYIVLKNKQNESLNWGMFYGFLYVIVVLPIINFLCVEFKFWSFYEAGKNAYKIPIDLYFIWVLFWSVIPIYFFKGKNLILVALVFFTIDLALMPLLAELNVFHLNENWLFGELLVLIFVFIPSYYWTYLSIQKKNIAIRAIFQIFIIACIFLIILPVILKDYNWVDEVNFEWSIVEIQIFIIISFPGLVAVFDLVQKGKGTPFPYDPTKRLVRSGIYAYCKNPIQWSFSLIFVLLSIYNSSFVFLLGFVFSIAYSYGVSDYQEYPDMEKRFKNKWLLYKKNVPKWFFLWKPISIPQGKIYFDFECNECAQLRDWFMDRNPINLLILPASSFPDKNLTQVTYVDEYGESYYSVLAISNALNHINLGFASLGWFIQFPLISHLIQVIIDALGLFKNESSCNIGV